MDMIYRMVVVAGLSLVLSGNCFAADPVPLPCHPNCGPIDPCKLAPERCKDKGGPIGSKQETSEVEKSTDTPKIIERELTPEFRLLEIVLSVLGALGGGVVIIGGFAHWLGNLWAKRLIQDEKAKLDTELESYKVKLKKSEFIFQKEFEAASELVAYVQSILPEHYMPDMIWDDACESIAGNLGSIETGLRKYLGKHGAILTDIAASNIETCIYLAGSNKHEIVGPDIPASASKAADEIFNKLKEAEKSLIEQVRGQSST